MSEEKRTLADILDDEGPEDEQILEVVEKLRHSFTANGKPTSTTEVYVKIKTAFREKALRLLKGPKLSCFLCVALHIDAKGESYPSIDRIVELTGYSRPTVCRALNELVRDGFIEKTRRNKESTLYAIKGYIWYGKEPKPVLLGEKDRARRKRRKRLS
jgi:Fic family protein